jgi:prephenate dehydratase
MAKKPKAKISFQGMPGAYSHLACREVHPELEPLPCVNFEDALAAVKSGRADLGMIPVENSIAGRVADIHHLLPGSGLHVVGEHYQPVRHQLLGVKGAKKSKLTHAHSHVHALAQCRKAIARLGLKRVVAADTAGSALDIAKAGDPTQAAIASPLAAEIYGLDILERDIADAAENTTRFMVLSRQPKVPAIENGPVVTTFIFRVRSVPAALFKALGGFATNGVNVTKLESYMTDSRFTVAEFWADIEGHPDSRSVKLALEELRFFSTMFKLLGVYPAHAFRGHQQPEPKFPRHRRRGGA